MNSNNRLIYSIHAAIWTIIFMSPLMFMNHGNGVSLKEFACVSIGSLTSVIVFYANYLWLTPKFFVNHERRYYWIVNLTMIVAMAVMQHWWMHFTVQHFDRPEHERPYEWKKGTNKDNTIYLSSIKIYDTEMRNH